MSATGVLALQRQCWNMVRRKCSEAFALSVCKHIPGIESFATTAQLTTGQGCWAVRLYWTILLDL